MFNKEKMRERYWELETEKEKVLAESRPLRDKLDTIKEQMAPLEKAAKQTRDAIINAERPRLPEIEQEKVMILKALSGNVGERPVIV